MTDTHVVSLRRGWLEADSKNAVPTTWWICSVIFEELLGKSVQQGVILAAGGGFCAARGCILEGWIAARREVVLHFLQAFSSLQVLNLELTMRWKPLMDFAE
jgi:hypothetical protein